MVTLVPNVPEPKRRAPNTQDSGGLQWHGRGDGAPPFGAFISPASRCAFRAKSELQTP